MRLRISEPSALKKPFLVTGAVAGFLGAAWYLLRTSGMKVPDPLWLRAVNVALILFSCVYVANLLRRVVELVRQKNVAPGETGQREK